MDPRWGTVALVLVAAAVFLKAIVLGGRLSGSFRSIPLLCNTGRLLIGVVVLQVALGVSALMVVLKGRGEAEEGYRRRE